MFTGIITDIGTILACSQQGENCAFRIATGYDTATIAPGASIACDGVCLTVAEKTENSFTMIASPETLRLTTAGQWQAGRRLNLERALRLGDELGGHLVSGHVDGIGTIRAIEPQGGSWQLTVNAPDHLLPFIAQKGSIALDGISLTVNQVSGSGFQMMIIPHTWEHTTLSTKQPGDAVNLEIDMLARYMARQLHWNNP